jgi:hypothetical protein
MPSPAVSSLKLSLLLVGLVLDSKLCVQFNRGSPLGPLSPLSMAFTTHLAYKCHLRHPHSLLPHPPFAPPHILSLSISFVYGTLRSSPPIPVWSFSVSTGAFGSLRDVHPSPGETRLACLEGLRVVACMALKAPPGQSMEECSIWLFPASYPLVALRRCKRASFPTRGELRWRWHELLHAAAKSEK